ncbi:hypothetical protein LPJ61_002968 [Coemansia biformis]|uniref:Uncharacterized protein n=1 Tax=Coemansia biformis TaxID=1286918 RepID=A0A9W8CZ32_9FUNG|nr:hypothetical protein LPJ61_002968 [Coemansia biformis]
MAARGSSGASGNAPPQAAPGVGPQQRRNSFAGWPQSIFGMPPAGRAQAAAAGTPQPTAYHPPFAAQRPAAAQGGAASLPDGGPPAFSGMGLFRRLSLSQAPGGAQAQPHHPSVTPAGLDAAVRARLQPEHRKDAHPLPRALDEVRAVDDTPPSRPDSRMRNLMLSGQFLI